MKKSILNLEGTSELSKKEQQTIVGGGPGRPTICNDPGDTNQPIVICYAPQRCMGTNENPYCG